MKNSPVEINALANGSYENADIVFCIKQLLENKIISRNGKFFCKGSLYNEYYSNILKCD